jgi:hypothetical protein
MRAIIIDDKDAKSLLEKLKLAAFRKDAPGYGIEQSEAWNNLPQGIRDQIISDMHGRFHYVVCGWLQEQGAKVT